MKLLSRWSNFVLPVFLVLSVAVTGCASKKKTEGAATDSTATPGQGEGTTLDLYGDSDSGKAGALKTVYFPFDSTEISGESRTTLDSNAAFLKTNNVKVQVEGHCDERGGVQYNLALGERRAKAIRDYLTALGIPGERVSTISYGKEKPLELGHDESSWSKNRRGNFVVTEK